MRTTPEGIYAVKGAFNAIPTPEVREVRGKDFMYYGEDNLFPQKLIELYDTSAMHHTAVNAITDGIIGDGLEVIGEEYINSNGETVDEVFEKIALDYSLYQGYALNVIWNKEGNAIAEIYHLPFSKVRSGKLNEDDKVETYFYSSDWANLRKNPYTEYKAFDVTENKGDDASQIYYCFNYTPGNDVYPLPSYVAALNDISLDSSVSKMHASNIANGLNPSMFIQFRNGIPAPEERREIYKEIENTFTGPEASGRFFLSFAEPGKEMEVTPITPNNDNYYIQLDAHIQSRILTAHRLTSPLLVGIKDASGFSNNADEIKVAYAHFEGTVIEPKRKKILSTYGYILALSGLNVKLTVKPNKLISDMAVTDVTPVEPQNNTPSL